MGTISIPTCSSCGRSIPSYTRGVKFRCPNCGEVTIWRCEKCRKLVNKYICPKCGFTGP